MALFLFTVVCFKFAVDCHLHTILSEKIVLLAKFRVFLKKKNEEGVSFLRGLKFKTKFQVFL